VKWAMIERRGQRYGEFARVTNPSNEAVFYFYLKNEAKSVKLVIKDLEGNVIQEIKVKSGTGLQKATWNLRKKAEQPQGNQQRFRRRTGPVVESGTYKVTLVVDDKNVTTKSLKVIDDPILK
jgi:hypothetical protein